MRLTDDGERRLSRLTPAHLNELRDLAPALNQLAASWAEHQRDPGGP